MTNLYAAIANTQTAYFNCIRMNNTEWQAIHQDKLVEYQEFLPHGSGFDSDPEIYLMHGNSDRIIIRGSYHVMNENGFYAGWAEYTVTVKPSWNGINIDVHVDYENDDEELRIDDLEDYISDSFYHSLYQEIDD